MFMEYGIYPFGLCQLIVDRSSYNTDASIVSSDSD